MDGKVFYIATILMMVIFLSVIYLVANSKTSQHTQNHLSNQLTIPLQIHRINDSGVYSTSRDENNIISLIAAANGIWSQAGIKLEIREIATTNADTQSLQLLLNNGYPGYLSTLDNFDPDAINLFLSGTLDGINGIAFRFDNSIMVADVTTVNDFRTTAHEVGHILGLAHVPPDNRLMARGKNGEFLTSGEILIAQQAVAALNS